jgi:uncharacterized protein with beta-barrel porin domain
VGSSSSFENFIKIAGGNGGNGGAGGSVAGSGGSGGAGVVFGEKADGGSFANSGLVLGGNGGAGAFNTAKNGKGGNGGIGLAFLSVGFSFINSGTILGGIGGNGGDGPPGNDPGAGGGGGEGAIIAVTGTGSNTGTISGGSGGNGGTAGTSSAIGGDGGAALVIRGGSFNNAGTITGGNGGQGNGVPDKDGNPPKGGDGGIGAVISSGTFANSGKVTGGNAGGPVGLGAPGIQGENSTIINSGTIIGGITFGTGAQGNAITFSGGTNALELQSGSTIVGNVVASNADTLRLGGALNSSFDVSQIGANAQYRGFGVFQKTGTSTWTLTGTNSDALSWTINAGTLAVNATMASSNFTANTGGTIEGTGTVGSVTINGGTLGPGNSIGTLTIQGSLVLTSAAVYLVEVSPSRADRINDVGTTSAKLAGTVEVAFAPGSYTARSYNILHATGGLGGTTFGGVTSNVPGFAVSLSYTPTDVLLNVSAALGGPQQGTRLSQNQQSVASSINNFFNSGGTLPPNFGSLFGLTGGNLGNALSQLSGEPATGSQQAAFQLGNHFLTVMLDPFVDGRGGFGGAGSAAGRAIGFAPEREPVPQDVARAYAAVLKAPRAQPAPTFEQRWGVWGAGYGGSNRTSGDPAVLGSHDLSARTAGFAGGFDYRFSLDTTVGIAFAGGGTDWSLAQGLGGGRSDAFQAGLYGVTRWDALYLAASFAYTNHWMSTDRFAFAGDHLTANFNAQSFGGRVEGGYRFATIYGGLTPYAAIQSQNFRTPSYSESDLNGGGFALSYNSRSATDARSELGARFDRLLLLNPNAALIMRARLAWAHDWVSDPTLAAAFQTLPGASFIVNGATAAENSALASAGTELRFANGVSLLAKFDGEFASHSSTYAGTGTVRYTW